MYKYRVVILVVTQGWVEMQRSFLTLTSEINSRSITLSDKNLATWAIKFLNAEFYCLPLEKK